MNWKNTYKEVGEYAMAMNMTKISCNVQVVFLKVSFFYQDSQEFFFSKIHRKFNFHNTYISYSPILMNIIQEFQVMVILKRQIKSIKTGRHMLWVDWEKVRPITSYSKQWSQQTTLPWNQVSNPIIIETFLILHIIVSRILVGSLEVCASRVNTFSNWSGLQTKNLENIVKKMSSINMDFEGEFDNLIVNQVSFSHSQFMF